MLEVISAGSQGSDSHCDLTLEEAVKGESIQGLEKHRREFSTGMKEILSGGLMEGDLDAFLPPQLPVLGPWKTLEELIPQYFLQNVSHSTEKLKAQVYHHSNNINDQGRRLY